MSDHTSAGIFSELYDILLCGPITAKELWELQKDYDFHPCNALNEDEAKQLGIFELWKEAAE